MTNEPIAVAAFGVHWDEEPGEITYFMQVSRLPDRGDLYATIHGILEFQLRQTAEGGSWDALPQEGRHLMLTYLLCETMAGHLKKRDYSSANQTMGVIHHHIGKPER